MPSMGIKKRRLSSSARNQASSPATATATITAATATATVATKAAEAAPVKKPRASRKAAAPSQE